MVAEYMTVKEFQEYLHIGRSKAYQLIKKDPSLPIIRVGRQILIDRNKLQLWLKNKEETTLRI